MYDYNYTAAAQLGYNASLATFSQGVQAQPSVIPCTAREFNLSQYTSTIVIQVVHSSSSLSVCVHVC